MPLAGDPDAVEEACRQLTAAIAIQIAGESVVRHGRTVTADWTGVAAPLALVRTEQDATTVRRVAAAGAAWSARWAGTPRSCGRPSRLMCG